MIQFIVSLLLSRQAFVPVGTFSGSVAAFLDELQLNVKVVIASVACQFQFYKKGQNHLISPRQKQKFV